MAKTIIEIETKTFLRFWLVLLGIFLLMVFLNMAKVGIMIVLIAAFVAVALQPLARKLDKIDGKRKRRSLSSIMAVIVVVLGVGLTLGLVGPVVVNETSEFLREAPEQLDSFLKSVNIDAFGRSLGISDLENQLSAAVRGFAGGLVENLSSLAFDSVGAISSFLTGAVMVVVLAILFMLQGTELLDGLWKMLDERRKGAGDAWRRVATRMADVVGKYISGQMLVAILDGVVVALAVLLLAVIFPEVNPGIAVPMGLLALILYMVPMFGPVVTCVITTVLILFNSLWAAVAFVVFYVLYEQVENNVIAPKIQGKGMDLPPLVILIAIVIGTYAFGLIGTLVAIPVAGCIKVLIEEYPRLRD